MTALPPLWLLRFPISVEERERLFDARADREEHLRVLRTLLPDGVEPWLNAHAPVLFLSPDAALLSVVVLPEDAGALERLGRSVFARALGADDAGYVTSEQLVRDLAALGVSDPDFTDEPPVRRPELATVTVAAPAGRPVPAALYAAVAHVLQQREQTLNAARSCEQDAAEARAHAEQADARARELHADADLLAAAHAELVTELRQHDPQLADHLSHPGARYDPIRDAVVHPAL